MPKIKNTNPQKTALNVGGEIVEFGGILEVDKAAAESLIASPNFEKASLAESADAKAKDTETPKKPTGGKG